MPDPYRQLKIDAGAPTPIASQLANQLKWLVASGQIQADQHLPPIRDLAQQLEINMHTVRAAYRQLEEAGLARLRQGSGTVVLGYERAQLAQAQSSAPTFTIGVLIPSYSAFYTPFLDAVEASAEDTPLMFLVCNTHDSAARAARWLDQLLSKGVDGIVIASRGLPSELTIEDSWDIARGFPPVVFADIPDAPGPSVLLDHAAGGRLTAEHMLEHGYTQPAVITPPLEWANVAEVFDGYAGAYAAAGHPLDLARVVEVDDFTDDSGERAATQLLQQVDQPEAIFASSDFLAIGALRSLRAAGLSVPGDVGLLGYGDLAFSGLADPSLTSAALDAGGMGAAAMRMLRQRMAGEMHEMETRLPVHLIVRHSCGCKATNSRKV